MIPSALSFVRSIAGYPKKDQSAGKEQETLAGSSEKEDEFGFVLLENDRKDDKVREMKRSPGSEDSHICQKRSTFPQHSDHNDQNENKKKELDFHEGALLGIPFKLSNAFSCNMLGDTDFIPPLDLNFQQLTYDFSLESKVLKECMDNG